MMTGLWSNHTSLSSPTDSPWGLSSLRIDKAFGQLKETEGVYACTVLQKRPRTAKNLRSHLSQRPKRTRCLKGSSGGATSGSTELETMVEEVKAYITSIH